MRRERFVLCLLATILLLYYLLPFEWLGPRHGKFFVHPERPAILNERCQYLEIPVQGDEGEYHEQQFRLRGIVIAYRHGERSPVTHVKNNLVPDCSPYFDIDRRAFDSYSNLVNSDQFKTFLNTDPAYPKNYTWHPHSSKCNVGHMTAEGALQHLKLGSFLHSKYKLQNLFEDINTADILLTSSLYPRTFQSAIAFAASFFYVLENFFKLNLIASKTTHFCMNDHLPCSCPKYDSLRKLSETKRVEEFHSETSSRLRQRIKILGKMVGMEKVNHPLQFLDVILGRYGCRRAHFPCGEDGDCLTLNDILQVAEEGMTIAKKMAKATDATKQMTAVEAFSVLSHLTLATRKAREAPDGSKIIKILSGHDITLEALVNTLGLDDRIPPHYGSRIVFEIFETTEEIQKERIFVRILFNGKDQTSNVSFCHNLVNGLCPASRLQEFAESGVLQQASLSSLEEVC